jgi:hypothetical protein
MRSWTKHEKVNPTEAQLLQQIADYEANIEAIKKQIVKTMEQLRKMRQLKTDLPDKPIP